MSTWKDVFGKRYWIGVAITMISPLLVLAVGALMVAAGLILPTSAWVLVCIAWGIAGFWGGRYALSGGERWLVCGIASLLAAMALFWTIGLTTPEPIESGAGHWMWYLVSGLAGTLSAAIVPCKVKRKTRKRVRKVHR
jgi:hypothetical protein